MPLSAPASISHVTVPCDDLGVAEEFYVGLLGFRVLSRVDAARRAALGWTDTAAARAAEHLGVVAADGGLRLDLFEYPQGVPAASAPKHPHIGLQVPPADFPAWHELLRTHDVVVDGPRRLGPPGQASLYFDDPSGNHLEIHTDGVDTTRLPFGGPERSLGYDWPGLRSPEADSR